LEEPRPVLEEPDAVAQEPETEAEEPDAVVKTPSVTAEAGLPNEITNSVGMKLKLIPAGEFMMGSPESDEWAQDDEKSKHRVRITKPFYLGVYEVTQAEYEKVMGENPGSFKGGSNPVEMVSWHDAVEFCKRLSAKEGKTYRLPTEAEWEYACRAGTTTLYCTGDDPASLGEYAWCAENCDQKTHPVGEKKPNAWGLHDMHGNVLEWCADWYGRYASEEVSDPSGPETGSYRVDRGGSWFSGARYCRSADRGRVVPILRGENLGFRVASVPSGGQPSTSQASEAESGG